MTPPSARLCVQRPRFVTRCSPQPSPQGDRGGARVTIGHSNVTAVSPFLPIFMNYWVMMMTMVNVARERRGLASLSLGVPIP